jgi:hypothetical protein
MNQQTNNETKETKKVDELALEPSPILSYLEKIKRSSVLEDNALKNAIISYIIKVYDSLNDNEILTTVEKIQNLFY